jgi:hypothetical protein
VGRTATRGGSLPCGRRGSNTADSNDSRGNRDAGPGSSAPARPDDEAPHLTESGHGLDVREIVRLSLRTLPYLKPTLVELKPLLWVGVPLLLLSLPAGMLGADLFLNRMLNGEPLTSFEATLLRLDPTVAVEVESLSFEMRRVVRDHLVIGSLALVLVLTPIGIWF